MRPTVRIGGCALRQGDSNTASRARVRSVEHAIRILAVAIVALFAAGQAGWVTRTAMLPAAAIGPLKGHAFQIRMPEMWSSSRFVSVFYRSDSMSDPAISSMRLNEGPFALGPPHSLHQDIIEQGGGRFSHWNDCLYFSASDNSDPRTNGRSYSVAEAPAVARTAAIPALLMLGLILVRLRMGNVSEIPELAITQKLIRNMAGAWLGALRHTSYQGDSDAARWGGTRFVERAIRILAVAIVGLTAAGEAGWLTRNATLAPATIIPLEGKAYLTAMPEAWGSSWFGSFFYPSDSMSDPAISSMQLTEGSHSLGPPHSLHVDIISKGGGRFSNWRDSLYFSASDNSDPRTNARAYKITAAPDPLRIAAIPALLMLGIILLRLRMDHLGEMPELAIAQRLLRKMLDTAVVVGLIAVQVYLLRRFGLYEWKDNDGSLYYLASQQFESAASWISVSGGEWSPTLYRLPGYPLLILAARWLAGEHWQQALSGLQITVAVAAGFVFYRTIACISGMRLLGVFAALIWACCERGRWDRSILTDSLTTSITVIVICWLTLLTIEQRTLRAKDFIGIGFSIAFIQLLRTMTAVFVLSAIPLIALAVWQHRFFGTTLLRMIGLLAPATVTVVLLLVWNYERTGHFVVTTEAAVVGLQPLVDAQRETTADLFGGTSPLDHVAHKDLHYYTYADVAAITHDLYIRGVPIFEQMALANERFVQACWQHPVLMARLAWRRLQDWQDVLLPLALADWEKGTFDYPSYTGDLRGLFKLCLIVLPAIWLFAAALIARVGREAAIVWALVSVCLGQTIAYAALHLELRYIIFTIAPLLLILAISMRAVVSLTRVLFSSASPKEV